MAICTFLFSVQRSPPSHSSARFLWFQIEVPVSSVRKDIRQILRISRLLVVCCPLQGGRFPVQFASLAPFVCETKSEDVTHEEYAHSSYSSLSHDCDMRSESWRAGKSATPSLGRSVSSTPKSRRDRAGFTVLLISSMRKWRNCAFLLPVRRSHLHSGTSRFSVCSGGFEGFRPGQLFPLFETCRLRGRTSGFVYCLQVVTTPAPTSAPSMAPTIVSARRPCARMYSSIRGSST